MCVHKNRASGAVGLVRAVGPTFWGDIIGENRWAGRVARTGDIRSARRILGAKREGLGFEPQLGESEGSVVPFGRRALNCAEGQ